MTHEGARRLARALGLPLVLDFRDPWSLTERVLEFAASPVFLRLAARYEARAVEQADLIVMNTELARRAMQQQYPGAADRIIAVLNGCDEGTVARTYAPGDPFRIAYAGSIYLDRSPATLFRALARAVRELSLAPGQIEVAFMGAVSQIDGQSLESHAGAAGVQAYVRSLPLGTRREAERFLSSAHVLVNLYQDSRMAIPSKIFEYMRHEAALLVLAEPESAPYELVRDTDAALAAPDDVDAIAAAIRKQYEKHRAEEKVPALAANPRFSRRRQAERLLDALEEVCEAAAARGGQHQ
jgi:glycosyltransferase involved in cell wall biosynthesis